jgi:hypothetical protein
MTIIAQDPSVRNPKGGILRTWVDIPDEELGSGPRGYRVHVVDYDSSQQVLYHPFELGDHVDPFEIATDSQLLNDPSFHAQNVYAIIMHLLFRFEFAMGRRISWGFGFHQLHVSPHAFADANAYYSEDAQGLFFGYFPGESGEIVFTCLSHDVVAHEATHALLDGLRNSYTLPSHPDQAGFHEGFADIVALLSVFGLPDVVRTLLPKIKSDHNYIEKEELEAKNLYKNVLLGLAEQFGKEASRYSSDCLRRAVERPPSKDALPSLAFEESHIRGEILSAAVLRSFVKVWTKRLKSWLPTEDKAVLINRVVEDACNAADHLLTMCIRALDYCPVVDVTFDDFLSALLTADFEVLPDDGKYKYREVLIEQFGLWGIAPASGNENQLQAGKVQGLGLWEKPPQSDKLNYEWIHRESLEKDTNEVFRFLWENRKALKIFENAYTWVTSVRPCIRIAPDGFVLKETVCEYRQSLDLPAGQLSSVCKGIKKPAGMPDDTEVRLNGGGVLIFDDFGRLKYHIRSRINSPNRQSSRLEYLWKNRISDSKRRYGFSDGSPTGQRFALMHMKRDGIIQPKVEWEDEQESKESV